MKQRQRSFMKLVKESSHGVCIIRMFSISDQLPLIYICYIAICFMLQIFISNQ